MTVSLIGNRKTQFDLSADFQTSILEEGDTVAVTSGYGIYGGGFDNTLVIIDGIVDATTIGYFSGDDAGTYATNTMLIVSATGELRGGTDGARVYGQSNLVSNEGLLKGAGSYGLRANGDGGTTKVVNSGTMTGGKAGLLNDTFSMVLDNSGTIKGGDYGIRSNAGRSDSGTFIDNSGVITGTTYGIWYKKTGAADQLVNTGTIKTGGDTAIFGNDSTQHILNKGKIAGHVYLQGGDDVFLARAGSVIDGTVHGGSGDDLIAGRQENDRFMGEIADDILKGGSGNDHLWGGRNDDTLKGGRDADTLEGGADNDTLVGGKGDDDLWGGTGTDRFVLKGRTDMDKIHDFDQGTDYIDLSAYGIANFKTLKTDAITYKSGDARIDMDAVGGKGTLIVKDIDAFKAKDFLLSDSGVIKLGLTEAETLDLSGYEVESQAGDPTVSNEALIKVSGTSGTATGAFSGAAGSYFIEVGWMNENDGVAAFELRLNDVTVHSWTGKNAGGIVTERIAVDLQNGDEITLAGTRGNGELARIDYLEVSADAPAPDALTDAFDFFAFAGQSNAARHFNRQNNDTTAGEIGVNSFKNVIQAQTGVDTTVIDAAVGGTSSNDLVPSSLGFWWNLTNNQPGDVLLQAVATIREQMGTQRDLDGIVWAQGEHDAIWAVKQGLTIEQAAAYLKEATQNIFEYFRTEFGNVPIFIQELGDFDPASQLATIRQAQAELITELDYVSLGAPTASQAYPHYDDIHFAVAAYDLIAEDLAQSAIDVIAVDQFNIA